MEMKNIFMYASHSSLLYWQDIENFTAKMLQFTLIGMSIVKITCFCFPNEEAMTFSSKKTELECTFKMEKSRKKSIAACIPRIHQNYNSL